MTSAFQNPAFQKGPAGDDRPASSPGSDRDAWRIKKEGLMRRFSTPLAATNLVRQTSLVPLRDERDTAHEFSAIVLPFNSGELAQIARRTKEAARGWKDARSLPSAWSIMHMARVIPTVNSFLVERIGVHEHPFLSPELMETMFAALYQVAHQPGPDGDAARAALSKMGRKR